MPDGPRALLTSELPDLRRRLALRPREAAAALGISERVLRQLAPELPRIVRRGVVLYPVGALQSWLAAQAKGEAQTKPAQEQSEADRRAREILEDLERRRI
jgi:hypothetical protein